MIADRAVMLAAFLNSLAFVAPTVHIPVTHTPAQLRHMYEQSAGSNNALIIDIAPFPNGSVPAEQVAAATALGKFKTGCYGGTPVASAGDGGPWEPPITIKTSSGATDAIDRVQIREDISSGQIVRAFTLTALLGNGTSVPLCPERGCERDPAGVAARRTATRW